MTKRKTKRAKPSKRAKSKGYSAPVRQVMERPARIQYVRKMLPGNPGCVFCEAKKAGPSSDSLLLYANEHAMIVLNKFPYNTGHAMVLPTRHCGDLTQLTDQEHIEIQLLLKRLVSAIKKEYACDGLNIGLNLGAVAGAGLPEHMHWHVVPRWFGDTNFFPLIAETKVVPEAVSDSYARLKKHFNE